VEVAVRILWKKPVPVKIPGVHYTGVFHKVFPDKKPGSTYESAIPLFEK
jgi:hypothetical protein